MASYLDLSPAEIQLLILCHLDSVETLFVLLRASPRILKIYQANRDVVFPRIVYNQITPHFVPVAITTLRLRNTNLRVSRSTFTQWFQDSSTHSELSTAEWKQLLRFQRIVDETIQYSVKNGLRLLVTSDSAEDLNNIILSDSERYRLLRATYNRELVVSIGKRYIFAMTKDLSEEDVEELEDTEDAEGYLQILRSLIDTWALYEFEEVFFISHHLQQRLIHLRDQAEHDRFEEWRAHGPYATRYIFEDMTQWVWSSIHRDRMQTHWLGSTVFGEDLAAIHRAVTEPCSIARIRHFEQPPQYEAEDEDEDENENENEERWKKIRTHLRHYRALKAPQLTSPLLPEGWQSCPLPRLGRDSYRFDEAREGPNLGLLWICRVSSTRSHRTRPNLDLLAQTTPWGAVIWDSARLQEMRLLSRHPGDVARGVGDGECFARIDKGRGSVEARTWKVEDKWIAKGLTKDAYCLDLPYYPYCSNCSVEVRDVQELPSPTLHTTEASPVVATEQSKGTVLCPECGQHDPAQRTLRE